MLDLLSIEEIVTLFGYLGIFILMTTNGASSFPSSQLLYIVSGFFISQGQLNIVYVVLFGALGNVLGNYVLYEIVRKKGLSFITRYKLFPKREIKKVEIVFKRHGAWFVFVGKLLPAIKVFVPVIAAVGKMNRLLFLIIMFIASIIWSLIFIFIGFIFGKNAELFGLYPAILIVVALFIVWIFYRYMNSPSVLKALKDKT